MRRQDFIRRLSILSLVLLTACSVNPVTGDREFIAVSPAQELQIGRQNYEPMQQSEGGDYDLDSALTRYVQSVGNQLAAVAKKDNDLPYEFVVLNNSVPNAWALPGGKIAVNRGLLNELHSEAELAAVLGHEIVHAAARHTAHQMSKGMILQGLVFATTVAASNSDYGNLVVGGANAAAQALHSTYSRQAELEADEYGMRYMSQTGYDPQGAVTLQETFVLLSADQRHDWLSGMFASHPPSPERVAANKKTAASLPAGGKLGVERFAAAIKNLRAVEPAYVAYDKGRKALANKDATNALKFANEALKKNPDEANFYALRGDVQFYEKHFNKAVTEYDKAIKRRGNFFYYPMQRGLVERQMGDLRGAEADLKRSIELLPTAPAYYALGGIEEKRGNSQTAIKHYQLVAQSGGDYGQAATAAISRLDLPANPGKYVAHGCNADLQGNLVVAVRNDSGLTIADIAIRIQFADSAGRTRQFTQTIPGPLPAGKVTSMNTGLGPYLGASCPAEVTSARVVE